MADALVIVLALVAGLAVGAWLGYLLAKREEAKAKDQLADTFKALATDALRGNSETFIGQATQAFTTVKTEAEGDLAQRQQAIEGLIKPLNEALQRYETQIANMVAGMVEHCDFREQETVQGETGRLRPDMIIQLPAGRQIVVDAKTVLAAYLEAVEAQDDEVRRERLRQHATQVRARMDQLSAKAYWSQFEQAPEFVVLFLPGEQFLGAALEYDRTLIEEGFAKKVVIATPTTLIALLRAVAYGWRQEQLAENAQVISALGKDLFERMAVLAEYLSDVGAALNKGVTAYNKAVGSLEARVLPSARRFKDLGIGSEKDIPKLESLEQAPRPVPEVDESNQ